MVFIDTGNVFPTVSDVRLGDLVGSSGFGLRLVTPFALFRVDYGKTIWNRPVADTGRWVFGIGQTRSKELANSQDGVLIAFEAFA